MLTVHHLNNSRSQRVLWMLEELGFEYELRKYERNPDMSAPDELKLIHPLGKSPIVEDVSNVSRLVLVETGAICEYLVAKADGKLGPPSELKDRLLYRQFLHYAEGSVMPALFAMLVASKVPVLGRFAVKRIRPMLDVHLRYVENELAQRPWFAGNEISAADIMMSFPIEAARKRKIISSDHPATQRWLDRIHGRPAYKAALQRGGTYAFA